MSSLIRNCVEGSRERGMWYIGPSPSFVHSLPYYDTQLAQLRILRAFMKSRSHVMSKPLDPKPLKPKPEGLAKILCTALWEGHEKVAIGSRPLEPALYLRCAGT